MTRSCKRGLAGVFLGVLALGSNPGCSTPSGPSSGPCIRETIFSSLSPLPESSFAVQRITTPRTGRLRITVDWVSDDNIVSVTLTQAPCSLAQFKAATCNVITDMFPPPKPLEEATTWLRPASYDLIIANFSPADEIAALKVDHSSAGCATP